MCSVFQPRGHLHLFATPKNQSRNLWFQNGYNKSLWPFQKSLIELTIYASCSPYCFLSLICIYARLLSVAYTLIRLVLKLSIRRVPVMVDDVILSFKCFVTFFIKLDPFWWNLVNSAQNKFAIKQLNVFQLTHTPALHSLFVSTTSFYMEVTTKEFRLLFYCDAVYAMMSR